MKQIAVISGKGGTGKTTMTAALAGIAKNKVTVDCDVDAADLHLILNPKIQEEHDFVASKVASINFEKCKKCGRCKEVCRFGAISKGPKIDPVSCEGCGVCFRICPNGAIDFKEKVSGKYFISDTRFGPLVHAKLGIAEENSGRLVSLIRKESRKIAEKNNFDYILIDGSPGIGCPVIASITGVDLVLIVTEPTLSGLHDLERVAALSGHFKIKTVVAVNKYDINPENTRKIEALCSALAIPVVGRIRYDKIVNKAMISRKTVIEYDPKSVVAKELGNIWQNILAA
ncbi:(4Fe-4S)-binding protein [candidate division WOR-1 bacterium RIFOXYA12_FULL_43_27]|uniref:(4Fe-4S)-binding protein n=1 Tax=candidate division WOR-1 bacterium RIFOXYC2_FULL_46_14 TaxID=1802587 RepID=A0A1F4U7H1_UNCSA|nr:MAG: (4Fe-4S)-binding protein [candidate division WOR-1 bacterium RIFOXYA12_FULL_43_27]OGC19237.1 MAG: (4Fe-4S)-binding protein [candidate division WOR-1 bacterium RIFOXYB2_FULL_46_45]OGC30226.1 MAG: (4Fe-4S)-binding protein [candidate division WOR-1 bacterium RIFOXYA2_FULL_46_56]OGC40827.1 MAG: (4Fe-4S)-binding protein [candidate division WOR-1 bacterium RIFOXYC2_FULL_46_14]